MNCIESNPDREKEIGLLTINYSVIKHSGGINGSCWYRDKWAWQWAENMAIGDCGLCMGGAGHSVALCR